MNEITVRVGKSTSVGKAARAFAERIKEGTIVEVVTIGAVAGDTARRAVIRAREFLLEENAPSFKEVTSSLEVSEGGRTLNAIVVALIPE